MTNKNNQIRNKMIQSYPKTDRQKLAGVARHIYKNHPTWNTFIEPYLIFTKGEDKYLDWTTHLPRTLVERYLIHPCDMLIITNDGTMYFELDGPIHDIKTEKTAQRDRRYELNNMKYLVINEADLKHRLGIPKSRPLTQEQINEEFDRVWRVFYAQ